MGEERERDDTGRFNASYSDEEFLEAVKECSPAGTAEIAEAVGCHEKAAYKRLRKLAQSGEIDSKLVGHHRIWFGGSG